MEKCGSFIVALVFAFTLQPYPWLRSKRSRQEKIHPNSIKH